MITSKKVFEFVDRLRAVAGRGRLCDMYETTIEPECKTPGCHGGWAYLALRKRIPRDSSFSQGAEILAKFLGFSDQWALSEWAETNSEIWGNSAGYEMFANPLAFNRKSDVFPIQVIIKHWEKVGKRLEKLEKASENSRKPLTKPKKQLN